MKKRIKTGKVIHKGQELECYIPQILINKKWRDVLQEGSYILKEGYDAYDFCSKCNGEGCPECNDKGFRKVPPKDNKYIAEILLNNVEIKYSDALKAQKEIRKNISKDESNESEDFNGNLRSFQA